MSGPAGDDPSEPPERRSVRRAIGAVTVDLTPLRDSRDFRLLWIGEVITVTGQQVTFVALLLQIYALTHSALALGAIGLVEFVPLMIGTAVGGPLIDRYDRRNVLLTTQSVMALSSAVLLATTFVDHPPVWVFYAAAGLASLVSGIDVPARSAITPTLVSAAQLTSALNLNFMMWAIATIAGPFIGGLIIGVAGLSWAYGLDLVTYGLALLLVAGISRRPPAREPTEQTGWQSFKEGLSYLKGRRVLQGSFSIDLFAMVFGLPEALFPILVVTQFGGSPAPLGEITGGPTVGKMLAAVAVGSLVASASSGWTKRIRHQGKAVVAMVILWGSAISVFGLIGNHLWTALVLLAIAGGADTISAVFRSTILQTSVPDELRGRLSAIHFFVVSGGPRLGNMESGLVAALTSPLIAVVSGGVICVLGAVGIGVFNREFRTFHAGGDT